MTSGGGRRPIGREGDHVAQLLENLAEPELGGGHRRRVGGRRRKRPLPQISETQITDIGLNGTGRSAFGARGAFQVRDDRSHGATLSRTDEASLNGL